MSKRTLFLIFALFVITFVLLIITLYNPSNPKPAPIVTVPKESVEQTILSFGQPVATSSSSVTSLTYSLPITIITGKNKVTAIQLELQYDPKVLSNVSIAPGSFFTKPEVLLEQIDVKTGRITYAFGVGLTDQGVMGQGVVATLTFEAKKGIEEETVILFVPKTLVTAEEITESVLKKTNVAKFTVGKSNSTPSAPSAGGPNQ